MLRRGNNRPISGPKYPICAMQGTPEGTPKSSQCPTSCIYKKRVVYMG